MNTKVVSLALFGTGEGYAEYVSTFALAHANLFPKSEGWRLYLAVIDEKLTTSTKKIIGRLASEGLLEFEVHPPAALCKTMLLRMHPVFQPDTDFVFCRDLDAIPMPRDRACCDAFISAAESKKVVVSTIHDHQMHVGIMGGLCGFYAPALCMQMNWHSVEDIYAAANYTEEQWDTKGADQLALNKLLLKANGPRLFEHRFNGWHGGPGVHPARGPGQYACAGVSAPVPDTWGPHDYATSLMCSRKENKHLIVRADLLGRHLGCAGYNIEAARKFWFEYGDREIADKIRACEAP